MSFSQNETMIADGLSATDIGDPPALSISEALATVMASHLNATTITVG